MKEIVAAVKARVEAMSSKTPKILLDKIRKDLFVLLAQSDVAEITGNLEDVGGKAVVEKDVAKAILNLIAVSEIYDIDIYGAVTGLLAEQGVTVNKASAGSVVPASAASTVEQEKPAGSAKQPAGDKSAKPDGTESNKTASAAKTSTHKTSAQSDGNSGQKNEVASKQPAAGTQGDAMAENRHVGDGLLHYR